MPDGTPEVPVCIVGGGSCGLSAAIALRQAGIEALVLERDANPTGSTALSSGFIPAAQTRLQRALGIEDSYQRLIDDVMKKAHGQAPLHLVEAYVHAVTPAIDTLERLGLPFEIVDGFLYPGHSVRRMHTMPEKTGATFMTRLAQLASDLGADVLGQALVRQLWIASDGRVLGVGYQRPDGQMEHLACQYLLLACNGFGGAPDLVRQLLPEMAEALYAGHAGNDGSAILWGRQLGARLADLGAYQGHGSWAIPQGALISWALMMEGGVQINARGERFHDETQGYSEAAVQVLAQPGGVAWNVFDEALLRMAQDFPDFVQAQEAGAVQHAADTAALAALIGCDSPVLERTLAAVTPGTDAQTGRHFRRALQAPFHAVRVTGALFHTQGGLDIDAGTRVLREDGTPLPNLLAAGGAARGVSGQAVWGYLSGNGLLSAVAGGHISAQTAAQLLQTSRKSP